MRRPGARATGYITVVTDHDAGRIVWTGKAATRTPWRSSSTTSAPERAEAADACVRRRRGLDPRVVREKAPQALICLDAFHVVKWAGEALDKLRRRLAADLRAAGKDDQAATLGQACGHCVKNPQDLSPGQRARSPRSPPTTSSCTRLPDERAAPGGVPGKGEHGKALLAGLIAWASAAASPSSPQLARTLKRFRQLIWNTLDHAVSNGRAEGINTQLAALTARARGFHSADAFIAMAELTCGGLCPDLPGR